MFVERLCLFVHGNEAVWCDRKSGLYQATVAIATIAGVCVCVSVAPFTHPVNARNVSASFRLALGGYQPNGEWGEGLRRFAFEPAGGTGSGSGSV